MKLKDRLLWAWVRNQWRKKYDINCLPRNRDKPVVRLPHTLYTFSHGSLDKTQSDCSCYTRTEMQGKLFCLFPIYLPFHSSIFFSSENLPNLEGLCGLLHVWKWEKGSCSSFGESSDAGHKASNQYNIMFILFTFLLKFFLHFFLPDLKAAFAC